MGDDDVGQESPRYRSTVKKRDSVPEPSHWSPKQECNTFMYLPGWCVPRSTTSHTPTGGGGAGGGGLGLEKTVSVTWLWAVDTFCCRRHRQ